MSPASDVFQQHLAFSRAVTSTKIILNHLFFKKKYISAELTQPFLRPREKLLRGLSLASVLMLEYWGRAGVSALGGEAALWGGRGIARDVFLSPHHALLEAEDGEDAVMSQSCHRPY